MSYRIVIGGNNIDLFPEQEINISLDYYDNEDPSRIKIPFSFEDKFPYTSHNKSVLQYNASSALDIGTRTKQDYTIYNGTAIISSGKASITSVVVNSSEPYFNISFTDRAANFASDLRDLTFADMYNDTFSTTVRTLQTYLENNEDYSSRDIEIPFVDVDNIQKAAGYEARQLTTWGIDGKKFGLFPALRVVDFLDRVFTSLGFNYTSQFIAGTATWAADDLYLLYPAYLSTSPSDARAEFLFPYPYNVPINQDQELGSQSVEFAGQQANLSYNMITNYKLTVADTYEPHGPTNYNPTALEIPYDYGFQYRTSTGVADYGSENLGYIAYGSAFDAVVNWTDANGFVTINGLRTAIVSSEYEYSDIIFPVAVDITSINTAKFTPYVYIYGGYSGIDAVSFRIPMRNVNGDILSLTPESIVNAVSQDDPDINLTGGVSNTLTFAEFDAYIDDEEVFRFLGGTRYSVSIGLELSAGELTVDLYTTNQAGSGFQAAALATSQSFTQVDIRKQRIFGYEWSDLGLKVTNAGNLPAIAGSDNFTFQDSLGNNDSYTPYDLFTEIMQRFGLSLVYDYRQGEQKFIFDNMNDVRSSIALNISEYVDNLKEYEISAAPEKYKEIELSNKDFGGFYDKFDNEVVVGSYKGELNADGEGTFKIDFKAGLINPTNKTVCGDSFFNDPLLIQDGLISIPEAGQIKNSIQEYSKIGLRFFYLRAANSSTTLRYPVFRRKNDYGQIIDQNVYKSITTVKLQGRTINGDFSTTDLRFADKNGNTFDAYDYLLDTERFKSNGRAKITFYAAFPNSYFVNGYFFNRKFTLSTGETVVVKSFTDAKMYNQYIYGKVEAIFVD
jgi:hypothetical protein